MLNIGIDFGLKNNIINGSIEYYMKKATDILGNGPIAAQTGITQFFGNIADMNGHGIDITVNSRNITAKNLQWTTTLLFSHAIDQVTTYKLKQSTIGSYIINAGGTVNPLEGKPVYSIYSYKWAGLDSVGNPQAVLDGKVSQNYAGILGSTNFDNLHYNGPATPAFFGSLRNTITWKQVSFSFNVVYKFGYYFTNSFITRYDQLFGGFGYQDYQNRWQKPGDEKNTNVPSLLYPDNSSRDQVYAYSDINVLKGDHIRLQDIQFSYDLNKRQIGKLPFSAIRFYVYANNIGIIWKANDKGIDPDAISVGSYPNPRTYAAGVKMDF